MVLYLRVGLPTWLTTSSTRVSQVLGKPSQKSTRIEICKKFSTQPPRTIYIYYTPFILLQPFISYKRHTSVFKIFEGINLLYMGVVNIFNIYIYIYIYIFHINLTMKLELYILKMQK